LIRINLLPQKRNRRQEAVRNELTMVGIGAGLLLASLLTFHLVSVARAGSVSATNTAIEADITQKQEIVKEIQAAEEAQQDLEQRLKVIKQLKANKSGPVRMLDELALATPDKLQMTSLVEKRGLIQLSGISVSNEVISQFLSNLEQSEYFTDVLLIGIDQTEEDGVKLKSFSITSRLVVPGNEPPDARP
jgi:type IV pilus assembly protein PilN